MQYDTQGSWLALAGLIVTLLSKFFQVSVTTDDVLSVIGGVVALMGIVKQWLSHRELAVGARSMGMKVGGLRD